MKMARDFDPGIGFPLLLYTTAFAIASSSLLIASTLLYTSLAYYRVSTHPAHTTQRSRFMPPYADAGGTGPPKRRRR